MGWLHGNSAENNAGKSRGLIGSVNHRYLINCLWRCNYFTFDTSNLWRYLKTTKSSVRHSHPRLRFPPLSLFNLFLRYISGSDSILCEDDNDNEIEVDAKLEEETRDEERQKKPSKTSSSQSTKELATPILSVYHASGYRTVLSAIPSTFGLKIRNDTEVLSQTLTSSNTDIFLLILRLLVVFSN